MLLGLPRADARQAVTVSEGQKESGMGRRGPLKCLPVMSLNQATLLLTLQTYFCLFFRDHVQLLFTHPGLGFGGVEVKLLGHLGFLQPSAPLGHLVLQLPPHLL